MAEELSLKEYITLRLMCLKPYLEISSKHGIESDEVLNKAEKAWEYATKTTKKERAMTTGKTVRSKKRGRPYSKKS